MIEFKLKCIICLIALATMGIGYATAPPPQTVAIVDGAPNSVPFAPALTPPPQQTFDYHYHENFHRIESAPIVTTTTTNNGSPVPYYPSYQVNRGHYTNLPIKNPELHNLQLDLSYNTAASNFHRYLVFFTGGAGAADLTNQSVVVINNNVNNTYTTTQQTQWGAVAGVGFNGIFPLHQHQVMITFGPAFYFDDIGKVQGIEYPFTNALPANGTNFDTLTYSFFDNSYAFMVESHVVYAAHAWQPFAVIGIGSGWNHMYDYSETPADPNGTASAAPYVFQNNTDWTFAFDVGLGVQHQIYADNVHDISYNAALEYRYFNFGEGKLAQSAIQTGGDTLRIDTVDSQTILLTLSAAFD